jgi:hypothetical protein
MYTAARRDRILPDQDPVTKPALEIQEHAIQNPCAEDYPS